MGETNEPKLNLVLFCVARHQEDLFTFFRSENVGVEPGSNTFKRNFFLAPLGITFVLFAFLCTITVTVVASYFIFSNRDIPDSGRDITCQEDNRISQEDMQWRNEVPNLSQCMYGYNPFEMDRFTRAKPDPGIRSRIFEPKKSFVDYPDDIICSIQQTTTVVSTLTDFLSTVNGNSIFEESGSENSNQDIPLFPFSLFVSYQKSKSSKYKNREESDFERQRSFFQESQGEAYINQAKCLVSRVSINRGAKAYFTESFKNALRMLHIAAKNPNNDSSKKARINFIQEYGTHYFSKASTSLGLFIFKLKHVYACCNLWLYFNKFRNLYL